MSLVGSVRVHETNLKNLTKAIDRSLDLISFNFDRRIKKVVIKPNLCYYSDYTTGRTTNPLFVSAVIDILRQHISTSTEISIVESDATAMKCKYAFRFLGYEKMAKEKRVTLVNLTADSFKEVQVGTARKSFKFKLPETIINADLSINVPVVKVHNLTGMSGALKNVYGCNPYPRKVRLHPYLDDAIVCLNKAIKFDLCLVDATIVRGTTPTKLGLVTASVDPVATDVVASKIMGMNPTKVRHIMLAFKEGVGNIHFTIRGDTLPISKKRVSMGNRASQIRRFVSSKIMRPIYYFYFKPIE